MRALIVLIACLSAVMGAGIGDRLEYNAEAYDSVPLTTSDGNQFHSSFKRIMDCFHVIISYK